MFKYSSSPKYLFNRRVFLGKKGTLAQWVKCLFLVSEARKRQNLSPNWYFTCKIWVGFYKFWRKNFARFCQIFARKLARFVKKCEFLKCFFCQQTTFVMKIIQAKFDGFWKIIRIDMPLYRWNFMHFCSTLKGLVHQNFYFIFK